MTIEERQEAAKWFQNRASHTSMPGAKMMFKRAAEALSEGMQPQWIPCDWCKYNPPSSMDGKPCTICPAVGRGENE